MYLTDIYERKKHVLVTYNHRGFKKACKFWIEPDIEIDKNKTDDFSFKKLLEIEKLIKENEKILLSQLSLFYSNQPLKAIRK